MNDKRFLLFCYDSWEASGGLEDMKGSYDTLEEAVLNAEKENYDYKKIYDRVLGMEVWSSF